MTQNKTTATKQADIKRSWHLIDAENQVLGRLATKIATLLMGKGKTYFTRRLDCGDYVVVINAQRVRLTGKKVDQKTYQRYSGYPGGRKEVAFGKMLAEQPGKVIRHAVMGMLPKNKLQAKMITRLHVFAGPEHKFEEKFKK
ncbi:MAG: 50S ribosomal protein L13 [Candidatus Shapirobacteria bacterium]|nr:50S ribosomal protein L13 [Candidatus Shapirobacteria bacterium]MDD5073905.1 50S ribosomal protein L13 [Candidatus Shapirobacteria bacterium]MDD5481579.1 50S ribosomal protein L13 [Candidatus Shapirobacteria bacterium]